MRRLTSTATKVQGKPPRCYDRALRLPARAGQAVEDFTYAAQEGLLWIRFRNEAFPRELKVQ